MLFLFIILVFLFIIVVLLYVSFYDVFLVDFFFLRLEKFLKLFGFVWVVMVIILCFVIIVCLIWICLGKNLCFFIIVFLEEFEILFSINL